MSMMLRRAAAHSFRRAVGSRAASTASPLMSVDELVARRSELVIVDMGVPEAFTRAHIPGARVLPVHPFFKNASQTDVLPGDTIRAVLQHAGISANSHVVFYDTMSMMAASRAWWILQSYGVPAASLRILDGGWNAYVASGQKVEVGAPPAAAVADPLSLAASPSPQWLVHYPEVEAVADAAAGMPPPAASSTADQIDPKEVQVLDARTPGEYVGDDLRGNARGGHVPGAVNLPHTSLLRPDGTLKPAEELRGLFASAGLAPGKRTYTYCQMGVRAALAAVALRHAGFSDSVAVYEGSMYEYLNRPDASVVAGSGRLA